MGLFFEVNEKKLREMSLTSDDKQNLITKHLLSSAVSISDID